MIQTQENGKKPHFGPDLGPLGLNLGCQFFFQKPGFVSHLISWSPITMYNIRKSNDPILRKVGDGHTEGWTEGQAGQQTEESDFMGRCLTNVERPIILYFFYIFQSKFLT